MSEKLRDLVEDLAISYPDGQPALVLVDDGPADVEKPPAS